MTNSKISFKKERFGPQFGRLIIINNNNNNRILDLICFLIKRYLGMSLQKTTQSNPLNFHIIKLPASIIIKTQSKVITYKFAHKLHTLLSLTSKRWTRFSRTVERARLGSCEDVRSPPRSHRCVNFGCFSFM